MVHTGRCHCGGVRYQVTGDLRPVHNCHCEPCRRITGHHMAATATTAADLDIVGEDRLVWYRSAATTEYGFCGTCGSTLFWRSSQAPDHMSIAAGTLDPPTGLATVAALFMAEHGDYHTPEPVDDQYQGDQT